MCEPQAALRQPGRMSSAERLRTRPSAIPAQVASRSRTQRIAWGRPHRSSVKSQLASAEVVEIHAVLAVEGEVAIEV